MYLSDLKLLNPRARRSFHRTRVAIALAKKAQAGPRSCNYRCAILLNPHGAAYPTGRFIGPCLPTRTDKLPSGSESPAVKREAEEDWGKERWR
jgi:hypothetical protein